MTLFLLSWIGQGIFQWEEYKSHQEEHNQQAETSGFLNEFGSRTFENWQSEFLQLLAFTVLSAYLIHKGSPQSKDGDDEMMKKINKIEAKLDKLS